MGGGGDGFWLILFCGCDLVFRIGFWFVWINCWCCLGDVWLDRDPLLGSRVEAWVLMWR